LRRTSVSVEFKMADLMGDCESLSIGMMEGIYANDGHVIFNVDHS
jgi:hypothetical protein